MLVLAGAAGAQLVTINEDLFDSQGVAVAGSLEITTPAYLLPVGTAKAVTGATNATPIVITAVAHGFSTNHTVYITGVGGNTAANGTWRVTVLTADTFELNGSVGNGTYTSGGTAQRLLPVGPSKRKVTIGAGGNVNLQIEPTTTGIDIPGAGAKGYTHQVTYNLNDRSVYSERWNIPPTPTTTTVSAVRAPGVLNPTASVNLNQLSDPGTDTRNSVIASDGTKWVRALVNVSPNAVTATTYTVADTDRNRLTTFSNTSPVAVTLPQAGASSQFLSGWYSWFRNINTGVVTITPTTSTIDGAATFKLRKGQDILVISDGPNYLVVQGTVNNAPRSLFTSTADRTQANSVSELTIIGTGVGTLTLPAAFYDVAGKSARFSASGRYSTTGTPTLQFRLKHGSTVLGNSGAITTASGVTDREWTFDGLLTCRTTGSSGTVILQGVLFINTSTTAVERWEMVNVAAVTINTTVTQAVDLTIQWGTASASNTITGSNFAMWAVETPY